jgi:flagellar motor switch protein FliN/FliY
MSDGALSQEEIDSLLAGLDGGASSGPAPMRAAQSAVLSPQEIQAFKGLLDATVGAQSQNLSMITGLPATVEPPVIDATSREGFLHDSPEEVLAISVPFAGSLPGEHVFVMSKGLALKIASLANKDEGLSELDDMAISAVQECISTMTGTQITVVSERTGNRNIQSSVAEGAFGPKAMANVPTGDMARAIYQIKIGEDAPEPLVELFALSFVKDVLASIGVSSPQQSQAQRPAAGGQMNGQGMNMQGINMPGMNMQGMNMQGMPMGQGYGGMQGQMGQGQMNMFAGNPPNVQPVQFASLQMQPAASESGNIGLIMDVYMEMTVELGRTKKLIKEILGMGEGTIIELDKLAGEPVDILVNHKLIAKGEVVVIDENFGVRVTEIVSPMERMNDLS